MVFMFGGEMFVSEGEALGFNIALHIRGEPRLTTCFWNNGVLTLKCREFDEWKHSPVFSFNDLKIGINKGDLPNLTENDMIKLCKNLRIIPWDLFDSKKNLDFIDDLFWHKLIHDVSQEKIVQFVIFTMDDGEELEYELEDIYSFQRLKDSIVINFHDVLIIRHIIRIKYR